MSVAPPPPPGWLLVSPVFNVTARDRQNRTVVRLSDPVTLRFQVTDRRPASVLVHDGTQWVIVPSELDAEGNLVATVEHLTPYAAGRPSSTGSGSGTVATAETTRTSAPGTGTAARTDASPPLSSSPLARTPTPSARSTSSPAPGISPVAPTAVSTVAPAAAEAALKAAAEALKGRSVKITSAAGYTGTFHVAVPPAVQQTLNVAASSGGTAYYGLYNALNEAVTVQAIGGTTGTLTLLSEPKTSMPTSSPDAQNQLKSYFAGVRVTLTEVATSSSGYLYSGTDGATSYALGFVSYEGVPLAYVLAGSGSYQSAVRG